MNNLNKAAENLHLAFLDVDEVKLAKLRRKIIEKIGTDRDEMGDFIHKLWRDFESVKMLAESKTQVKGGQYGVNVARIYLKKKRDNSSLMSDCDFNSLMG